MHGFVFDQEYNTHQFIDTCSYIVSNVLVHLVTFSAKTAA